MGHTRDLQDELEFLAKSQYPGLHFSLSFQSVPDPNNEPWDPFNSTRAIGIETNEETFHEGWAFLHSLYNKGKSVFSLGAKMSFVGSKDHPDYKNDFTAKQNIRILMKRQKIFDESVVSVSTSSLTDIDARYQGQGPYDIALWSYIPSLWDQTLQMQNCFTPLTVPSPEPGFSHTTLLLTKRSQKRPRILYPASVNL